MLLKDRYLVVASLIGGRRFPTRPRCHLIAEAKFDGEVLTSDPVSHSEAPQIDQELAWELDRKGLTQHRLQRSSIKLQLFAVDSQSPGKEAIGYVMLDLRSASEDKSHKWYPVLHSKYSLNRPELYVGLFLDKDGQELVTESGTAAISGLASSIDPSMLRPVLHPDSQGGYYQIGPDQLCPDTFVLSVTLAGAGNLGQLIPTNAPIPSAGDAGFYFHFSLFGNPITSEAFADLFSAEFPTERSSIRIRSTVDMLCVFFEREAPLEIHLCCGEMSLGKCCISLAKLFRSVDHAFRQPSVIEKIFPLEPPTRYPSHVAESERANVAVFIVLRRESVPAPRASSSAKGQTSVVAGRQRSAKGRHSPPVRDCDLEPSKAVGLTASTPTNKGGYHRRSPELSLEDTGGDDEMQQMWEAADSNTNNRGCDVKGGNIGMNRMSYTVELRSVRDMTAADTTRYVYARYVYPMFGSAAPIITHPPIEIRRHQEVSLPQGYCAFEFGTSLAELRSRLPSCPLVVEIFARDRSQGSDLLLGTGKVDLSAVFDPQAKTTPPTDTKGSILAYSGVVNITSNSPNSGKVGELVYSLMLEDFGPLPTGMTDCIESFGARKSASPYSVVQGKHSGRQRRRSGGDVDARATREYRAALELENWKETEEGAFKKQLAEREKHHMMTLAEEWRKRDKEREMITKRKIAEYTELEEALRTTVTTLGRRERQLAAGEAELCRLRSDLERDHERKIQDLREASRRLTEDCEHRCNIDRAQSKHSQEQSREWQQKYQVLDKEFSRYKELTARTPESRLQSELGIVQGERAELERKLDASLKSKLHYKQMWGRALKEMARLKQKEENTARDQLKRQETELEHMRLRYLATEESGLASGGRPPGSGKGNELEDIKKELEQLRQDSARQTEEGGTVRDSATAGGDSASNVVEEHLARLIEERDSLLRTGVYTMDDEIIVELDREIRRYIAQETQLQQ